MTDIDITPKNNTELWKKHVKWYNLLLLKPLEEKKWDTEYYPLDQLDRDIPIEDLDEIGLDTSVENLKQIDLDIPIKVDHIP